MSRDVRSIEKARISVVIPVFNEKSLLRELVRRLSATLEGLTGNFDVVFVDDGSTDGTGELADDINREDSRFRCVHLTRNFGHQAAVTAGLRYANGDVVCVIDGDLQDPPEVLPSLIAEWQRGAEVVYGIREGRKESWALVALYDLFYRVLARLSTVAIPLDAGDFCLMSRAVVAEINLLPEKERFVRGLRTWVGFKQTGVRYERDVRAAGRSKYSFVGLLKLAISGIVSFSDKPLLYVMLAGVLTSTVAFGFGIYIVVYKLMFGGVITGYASLIASQLLLGGIQLTSVGIMCLYLSTIFNEVKARPTYIVRSVSGAGPGAAPGVADAGIVSGASSTDDRQ